MNSLHLMITGATGYIGARLAKAAIARGHRLTFLARMPDHHNEMSGVRQLKWSFDVPLSADLFAQSNDFGAVDAVIHLAHQWNSIRPEGEDENLMGTATLLQATRLAGVPRTIFCSTVSARKDALNRYGRVKWLSEQLFRQSGEVSARIGLVYGGEERGQWGALSKIVKQTPILPVPGASTLVQPIHIDNVCTGLLAMAEKPVLEKKVYGLAGADPVSFGTFLKHVALCLHDRKLFVFSVPISLALMGCKFTGFLPFVTTVDQERILGIAGIRTIETATDMMELSVPPDKLEKNLAIEATLHP